MTVHESAKKKAKREIVRKGTACIMSSKYISSQTQNSNTQQIVHAVPIKHATRATPRAASRRVHMSPNPGCTPFGDGGNVVAKARVGFGGPDTVTVGADGFGEGCEPLAGVLAGRMVKREDVEYMIPWVELMKRRK